ncbi:MAG TPA: cytochrome c [Eoetvoesiella sp.]
MKLMTRVHLTVATAFLAFASLNVYAATAAGTADAELIQRGKYLATAGDCIACHTVQGAKPFAGGLVLPTPVGNIVATNITPSKTHGIGNYTLEDFSKAVRQGRGPDGKYFYPAMPYTAYAQVTDEDIKAMYAYFMNGIEPVDAAPSPTQLPFPFNIRQSMAIWNLLFLDDKPFQPEPDKGELWNRGAYLARGLTHCTTCHTPRNMLMAENLSQELAGGDVGPWYAPNITSDANSGIGGWSDQEIVDYLKVGHTSKGQASGPMAEAIDLSLRHLTDPDLQAIAVYLKSVPAIHDKADTKPVYAWGKASDDLNSIRGIPWPDNPNQMTGPQLYDAHCATCHQAQAQGTQGGGLPALFHNTALGRTNTNNLVMVILDGITRHGETAERLMPGFRTTMSDQQIATLGTYLTQHYGNPEAKVTTAQVKTLRKGGESSNLIKLARTGIILFGAIVVLALIAFAIRRHGTR